jgi:hypothetical protein
VIETRDATAAEGVRLPRLPSDVRRRPDPDLALYRRLCGTPISSIDDPIVNLGA